MGAQDKLTTCQTERASRSLGTMADGMTTVERACGRARWMGSEGRGEYQKVELVPRVTQVSHKPQCHHLEQQLDAEYV